MHTQTKHTLCIFVCLFPFLFPLLLISLLTPKQSHTLSMTTNGNRVHTYVGNPVFLADFLFLLPSSSSPLFFFFYTSISLHLPSRRIHTYTQSTAIKEKNKLQLGNSLHGFSFFLSFVLFFFPFFTQTYNYRRTERLTLPQQLSSPMIYDRYRQRKMIARIRIDRL